MRTDPVVTMYFEVNKAQFERIREVMPIEQQVTRHSDGQLVLRIAPMIFLYPGLRA